MKISTVQNGSFLKRWEWIKKEVDYIVKSYLKMIPCGYCGDSLDPDEICYKCFPKGSLSSRINRVKRRLKNG